MLRTKLLNIAIVGSGPAGFYTAQKLLKNPQIKVDIYEKLPVPFGLVRYGVAPDHADVKNVINSFTKVAANDRINFFGNVSLGEDITVDDLSACYDAVVLAYGASRDKYLGIEGEESTKNVISARNFVGWYNGLPEDRDLQLNLDCDTACIVGQGNVALDCARILLKPEDMSKTDITSYAHKFLLKRKIRRLFIIGRRGPIQASFTPKELRHLIEINPSSMNVEPSDVFSKFGLESLDPLKNKLIRHKYRLAQLFMNTQLNQSLSKLGIECTFKFFSKPIRILHKTNQDKTLEKLIVQRTEYNNLDDFLNPEATPIATDDTEAIECGLMIRSIGYKAILVDPKLPYNHKLGAIANTDGRIHGFKNLYCSGWLATGAIGVIAGTLNSSQVTAQSILNDVEAKKIGKVETRGSTNIVEYLEKERKIKIVHFNDWLRIDELEQRIGQALGKCREKLVDVDTMLEIVNDIKI